MLVCCCLFAGKLKRKGKFKNGSKPFQALVGISDTTEPIQSDFLPLGLRPIVNLPHLSDWICVFETCLPLRMDACILLYVVSCFRKADFCLSEQKLNEQPTRFGPTQRAKVPSANLHPLQF